MSFLCFTDDVLEYAVNNNLNEKNVIQYYYPFLFKKIYSLYQPKNEQFNLIEESKKKLESVSDEQIDTFYKVSSNEIKVPYIKKGIYDVVLTLYPDIKIQMPLENIFKQLHCTKEIPFIKYKPGLKEELYDFIAQDSLLMEAKFLICLNHKLQIFKILYFFFHISYHCCSKKP